MYNRTLKTEYRAKKKKKKKNRKEEPTKRKVKLQRAKGECLGTRSRRRTQKAAKSHGEAHTAIEPWVSEWGNPAEETSVIAW